MKSAITLLSLSLLVSLACCVPANAMLEDAKKAKKVAASIAAELTKKNAKKAKEEVEKAEEDAASGSDGEASSSGSSSGSEDEAAKKQNEKAAKQLEEIKQKRQEAEKKAADAHAKQEAAKVRRDKAAAAAASSVPALEVLDSTPKIVAVVDANDPNAGTILVDKLAKSANNDTFQKGLIAFKFGSKIGIIPVAGLFLIVLRLKQNHDKGTLRAEVAIPALMAGIVGQVVDYKALQFVLGLDYTALSTYCGLALILYVTYLVAQNNMAHAPAKAAVKKIVLEPTVNGSSTPAKSE